MQKVKAQLDPFESNIDKLKMLAAITHDDMADPKTLEKIVAAQSPEIPKYRR